MPDEIYFTSCGTESDNWAIKGIAFNYMGQNTILLLLSGYVHGGPDGRGVLDRIMELQYQYGQNKIQAILGNRGLQA